MSLDKNKEIKPFNVKAYNESLKKTAGFDDEENSADYYADETGQGGFSADPNRFYATPDRDMGRVSIGFNQGQLENFEIKMYQLNLSKLEQKQINLLIKKLDRQIKENTIRSSEGVKMVDAEMDRIAKAKGINLQQFDMSQLDEPAPQQAQPQVPQQPTVQPQPQTEVQQSDDQVPLDVLEQDALQQQSAEGDYGDEDYDDDSLGLSQEENPQAQEEQPQANSLTLPEQINDSTYQVGQDIQEKIIEKSHLGIYSDTTLHQTKQSKAFVDKWFGKEYDPFQDENFMNTSKKIINMITRIAEKSNRTPPNLSIRDVIGSLWQNVMGTLGVSVRSNPGLENHQEVLVDNRLALFGFDEKLVPDYLQGEWGQVKQQMESQLAKEQQEAMAYNKPILDKEGIDSGDSVETARMAVAQFCEKYGVSNLQQFKKKFPQLDAPKPIKNRFYANRVGMQFIENSPIRNRLLEALNRMINEGPQSPMGEQLLKTVLERAKNFTTYHIGAREQDRAGQMPTTKDDTGNETSVEVGDGVGAKPREQRSTEEKKKDFNFERRSLKDGADLVSNIMDNVWSRLENSSDDPLSNIVFDKYKLRNLLFKKQTNDLLGDSSSSRLSDKKGISNEYGRVLFEPKTRPVKYYKTDPQTGQKVLVEEPYENHLDGIISDQAFADYYKKMMDMKLDIGNIAMQPQVAARLQSNSPDSIDQISKYLQSKPEYQDQILQAFANDPRFIKSTIQQLRVAKENPKQLGVSVFNNPFLALEDARTNTAFSKKLKERMSLIWNDVAADSLVAIAKMENKIEHHQYNDESEKVRAFDALRRAKQNYISLLNIHSSIFSEDKPSKLSPIVNTNETLRQLAGEKLTNRDIIMMILGVKPIPESLKQKIVTAGSRYYVARNCENRMVNTLFKLNNLGRDIYKVASEAPSLEGLKQRIREVLINGRKEIKSILGV